MNDVYKVRPVMPWIHIAEEIEARGWSVLYLRNRMHVDLSSFTGMMTGRIVIRGYLARELARVFGTSVELWINLDRSYREGLGR